MDIWFNTILADSRGWVVEMGKVRIRYGVDDEFCVANSRGSLIGG